MIHAMETVFCECKKCDAPIGRFVNLWTQIGKSYFSPVVEPEDDLAAQCHGAIRIGERGTLVEEWLASVELLDIDGEQVDFAIKRSLSINEPSRVSTCSAPDPPHGGGFSYSAFPGMAELQQLQVDLHNQREDIKRIDNNGFKIVSALDKRVGRIEGEVTKLSGTIGDLRRDISGAQKGLGSLKHDIGEVRQSAQDQTVRAALEDQLTSVSSTLQELGKQVATMNSRLRKEISELKSELSRHQQDMECLRSEITGNIPAAEHAKDIALLRAEISQLRREMAEVRAKGAERIETAFPPRELEILTSNIAKIGNRASQVETLQMELEILKGRVERAEASRQASDDRRPAHTVDTGSLSRYSEILSGVRKRASSRGLDSVSKRATFSPGYSDSANPPYGTPPAWPVDSPTSGTRREPPAPASVIKDSGRRGRESVRGMESTSNDGVSTRPKKR
ncbi:hypothetical protein VTK56DRAFT_9580 [Thermocarpiscus australiensis]